MKTIPQGPQHLQRPGSGLGYTIWDLFIEGFDLMIRTEDKITNPFYFHNRLGYDLVCLPMITTVSGHVQEGVCAWSSGNNPKAGA